MTSVIALWAFLAAIATWGSAYYAMRDPHSTSWVKIVFAGILLLGFLGALAGSHLIGSDFLGEGLFAHVMVFLFIWPMATIGAPLCLGSIIGGFVGMYRRRNRSSF
jgi:hypothetical protein